MTIDPYQTLKREYPNICAAVRSYQYGGPGFNILDRLNVAIKRNDQEIILGCLDSLIDWYDVHIPICKTNYSATPMSKVRSTDHRRIYGLIKSLRQDIGESVFTSEHIYTNSQISDININTNVLVFLSHSRNDKDYGDALEKFIAGLGVPDKQLVYTSHSQHMIPPGEKIPSYIKERINADSLMLFLWSDNYIDSSACMVEVGITMATGCEYLHLYLPGFDHSNKKYLDTGIDTQRMGVLLNGDDQCKAKMRYIGKKIVKMFGLTIDNDRIESLVEEFVDEIQNLTPSGERAIPSHPKRKDPQNMMSQHIEIKPFFVVDPIVTIEESDAQAAYNGQRSDLFTGYNKVIKIDAGDNPTPIISTDITRAEHVAIVLFSRYYYRRLTIRNIGDGAAYDIKITMQNTVVVDGWALTKNGDIVAFLIIDNTHDGMINTPRENYKLTITIEYRDLEGRRYKQTCSCEVNHRPSAHVAAPKTTLPELIE